MESRSQRWLAAGGLLAVVLGLTLGVSFAFRPIGKSTASKVMTLDSGTLKVRDEPPPEYFPKETTPPELVILVSGEMHAYLQPCGCARPQVGGLERRYELFRQLRERQWPVSAVDLGDVAPEASDPARRIREQGRAQFETALDVFKKMDYAAVGLGLTELALPLEQALGIAINYQPQEKPPGFYMLAANLNDKDGKFVEQFKPWSLDEPWQRVPGAKSGLRVGYVGVIAPSVAEAAKKLDATLTIDPVEPALGQAVKQIEEKQPDLLVLLFQGTRAEARELVSKYPQVRLVITLDDAVEPSALPERRGDTMLVSLGHKGKNVGLVGVWRAAEGKLELKYQLVPMTEHFELPDDKTNPARESMRDYVLRVQRDGFLEKWPRSSHPMQLDFPEAKYVGAQTCGTAGCHPQTYATWKDTKHAHAYENLAKYGRPLAQRPRKGEPPLIIGRQYDPECARCHTTGFEFKTGFVTEQQTPHLGGNQCENCHGPGSLHVGDPKNVKYSAPLRLSVNTAADKCIKCHDGDNDPHFKFETYWPKIRHGREQ
jgi:2',3'-cyclic-nucleotide 2'-phosphodiesterase (5'-nucleotidase family)